MACLLGVLYALFANPYLLVLAFHPPWWLLGLLTIPALILLNVFPRRSHTPTRSLGALKYGVERLKTFLVSAVLSVLVQLPLAVQLLKAAQASADAGWAHGIVCLLLLLDLAFVLLWESILFWNGMLPLFLFSAQLGIRRRLLAVFLSWIPVVNVWYLGRMLRTASAEYEVETQKWELNAQRAESALCRTRYPLLLVHGVFFRDFKYLNYWGRIPMELRRNGAQIYFGEQQSAASVDECGRELAARIRAIVAETGCEKVNIIAHSKGGLDSRAAISRFGAAPFVASLTTINTPHRGCLFAEYLLGKFPPRLVDRIAGTYNAALRKLGDTSPDFRAAVTDLTASACAARNETLPDADGVLYESVMSFCARARSGRFPLNLSYPLVRHFDGKNDGLVAVTSARWGSRFTLVAPQGARGISHGDMIDLNRENFPGFDVREFYVSLVEQLKRRGL